MKVNFEFDEKLVPTLRDAVKTEIRRLESRNQVFGTYGKVEREEKISQLNEISLILKKP